jgi:L,D-peptidoglycan transpeptidase YkuD (ErfK/YbiS/YcfS/YnhG family)
MSCALGRAGRRQIKREGDGATPVGSWAIAAVFYRQDRLRPPITAHSARPIQPSDGWCDDPSDRNYNRLVRLPCAARTEAMFRSDHVYDIVVVLNYNTRPRLPNRGSAIFCHLARPGFAPTEGCIALTQRDLRRLLQRHGCGDQFVVRG